MRRLAIIGLVAAGVLVGVRDGSDAQAPTPLEALLERAGQYELDFIDKFSNVVAEEQYTQQITEPRRKRVMRSDVLLVQYPGALGWLMFRDVFEVDGKSVRSADQEGRMVKLFSEPTENAVRRANDIAQVGSKYNLRDIGTLNHPLIAMVFLQPNYRSRFRFNMAGLAKDLGPDVRMVRFQEFRIPTILRAGANSDLPARGLMWIEESTGRVVKTELEVGSTRTPAEVVTLYKFDEELQINVPVEMRDWYPDGTGEIRGVATYGRFRRFQVSTDEAVQK